MRKLGQLFLSVAWLWVLSASPSLAFTSTYAQVNVAGDFNGWDTLNPNMTLVADNTWQADVTITNTSFVFKFSTAGFAQNWGLDTQPHTTLPQAATLISGQGDLSIANPSGATQYRFIFNDSTAEYAAFLLNNLGTNLLYNTSFETIGSLSRRARYWQANNPARVNHGDFWGGAVRSGPDAGVARTGSYVGSIPGTTLGGASDNGWWQEAPVEPGVNYEASAWFKVSATNWSASVREIKLEYYGFDYGAPLAVFTATIPALSTTWSQYAVNGVAPAGAVWARLVVNTQGVGPSGALYIDDASLSAFSARRTEDFDAWIGAVSDSTYNFAGWIMNNGRAVSSYTFEGDEIPLSRSGLAASLAGEGSYIQSPRFQNGVGTISFYFRHGYEGDPDESPTFGLDEEDDVVVSLSVQTSFLGDSWTEVATYSNILNTTFIRADVFQNLNSPYYIRIVHTGGSTNRLILDDVSIALPSAAPRIMNFDGWGSVGTNAGCHLFLNWQICTGIVSSSIATSGKGAQLFGDDGDGNYLLSPTFSNGYGTISFSYRRGFSGVNTVGLSLESSTNGTDWTVLDTISRIGATEDGTWGSYSSFYFQNTPHRIRIRNIRETNQIENIMAAINEGFEGAPSAPTGWFFSPEIGTYTGSSNVGNTGDPSLKFDTSGAFIITPFLLNPTNVNFMTKGQSINAANSFTVDGLIDGSWETLATYTAISNSKIWRNIVLPPNVTQLRFSYEKVAAGNLSFDDVVVTGSGAGEPSIPQRLLLDDVVIGNPVEYRTQNFDTWPTKTSYTGGERYHQGWVVNGSVEINTNDAYSGQAARLLKQDVSGILVRIRQTQGTASKRWNVDNLLITDYPGAGSYFVDFETDNSTFLSGSESGYAVGTFNLNGINWDIGPEALIGGLSGDIRYDDRAARIRRFGEVYGSITMLEGKPNGIGTISFYYSRSNFSNDRIGASPWFVVEYSADGGAEWTQIGAETSLADVNELTLFEETVNDDGSGGVGGDSDTYIKSHYYPDGIGSFSFRYRSALANPFGAQIGTLVAQTSADGVTWSNRMTAMADSGTYALAEMYLVAPEHHYFRVLLDSGTEAVLVDDIHVSKPQDPAIVGLIGWHTPELPFINDEVTLNAQVSPLYGAHSVTVTSYYRIGTSGVFSALAMESTSGNLFQSISNIPPQTTNTIVQYYMQAWYEGPGSDLTRPITWPEGAPAEPAHYGIPRNPPGRVWINEIDYRATVLDWWYEDDEFFYIELDAEFVELAGFADSDISGWRIDFVSGTTAEYPLFDQYTIDSFTIEDETEGAGFGFFVLGQVDVPEPPRDMLFTNTMRLNVPGAVRLFNEMGGLEHAVAYNGTLPGHPNMGVVDQDVSGLTMTSTVSQVGVGSSEIHFSWGNSTPTPGAANDGQNFADPAFIAASPSSLFFSYIAGSFNPPTQTLMVSNSGLSELTYELGVSHGWLIVDPLVGDPLQPGEVGEHTVLINTTGMSGNRSGTITILSGVAPNSPQSVPVSVTQTVLGSALLDYPLDRDTETLAVNQGTIGVSANLTLSGGAAFTLQGQGVSGKLGDYAYIGATNTALARTTNAVSGLDSRSAFTITGWLRPSATNGVHYVVGNRASNQGFEVMTSSDYQNLSFVSSAGTAPSAVTSTNGLFPTNVWTFFAITYDSTDDGDEAVRYYRGDQTNSIFAFSTHTKGALGTSGTSTNRFHVGGTGSNAYQGWMDDVRVFDGALDLMTLEAVRKDGVTRETGEGSAPSITSQPDHQTVQVGQQASFSVTATGLPLPGYQWRYDGDIIPDANLSQLIISDAQLSDAGPYDVIVFNVNGTVTSVVANLTVHDQPRIQVHPTNNYVYVGDTVQLSVSATGVPSPNYRWRKDGTNNIVSTSAIYTINNAQVSHSGVYSVLLSNQYGTATSSNVVVQVLDPEDLGFDNSGAIGKGTGNAMVLRWATSYGRTFDVYWSTNVMAGKHSFVPIATNIPATPPLNVYTDSVYGVHRRGFYFLQSTSD